MRAADYDYRRGLLESRLRFWASVPNATAMCARIEAELRGEPMARPEPQQRSGSAYPPPPLAPRQPPQGPVSEPEWEMVSE